MSTLAWVSTKIVLIPLISKIDFSEYLLDWSRLNFLVQYKF